ncbi:RNA-dependent DNA polymerase [Edwardsiella tarda]|uniref:RNA-directed DNA polymerase n=2 Tax=Edwardsiella tarda TaxID=636 RepID=A0A2A7U7R4_EDWTA|nr:RNA-dependent DNA polymerase [Edwardsiella tarda]
MLNLTTTNKEAKGLAPQLPNVEPNPNTIGKSVTWENKKLKNYPIASESDIRTICSKIENGSISITSTTDVANLLEVPIGQLLYILYQKKDNYKSFKITKKNGGVRIIDAPCGSLSILQEKLKPIIEYFYRPKKSAHGFIKNKSILTNAEKHIKKKYVINIDLEDYFGSVTFARVYGIFKSKPFNFSHSAASILAQLCTKDGKLPQGACTSPVLANLASASLDKHLTQLAQKKQITYTRYADDITFSFKQKQVRDIIIKNKENDFELSKTIVDIVERNGFKINFNKFRVQKKSERQKVTGLVVNKKVNIERSYLRVTRSMIHKWRTNRSESASLFSIQKGYTSKNKDEEISIFRNHIYGRLSFIRMIRGNDFPAYLKLMAEMSHHDTVKTREGLRAMKETETYDVFICHASEDKESIATPIYNELVKLNIATFIDHIEIKWGDSLVDKINSSLVKSKYVIAILSTNSIRKHWPRKELHSVLSREINDNKVKLLPLIKKDDTGIVLSELPLLCDKLYVTYDNNPEEIANMIQSRLGK